jgi:hypothetical protein
MPASTSDDSMAPEIGAVPIMLVTYAITIHNTIQYSCKTSMMSILGSCSMLS